MSLRRSVEPVKEIPNQKGVQVQTSLDSTFGTSFKSCFPGVMGLPGFPGNELLVDVANGGLRPGPDMITIQRSQDRQINASQ